MATPPGNKSVASPVPLADRMRPRTLAEFIGQGHLLGPGKPLRSMLEGRSLHSLVLWGPPGTGKTTLARMVANAWDAHFVALSAVMAGVKEVRAAVEQARKLRDYSGQSTLLFLDEVHRFNKAQQDAFLPWVENGTLTFVGATTENPSFELNNALLSRARVYVLKPLTEEDLVQVLRQALGDAERGVGAAPPRLGEDQLQRLAKAADGDARRALSLLEIAADLAEGTAGEGGTLPDSLIDDLVAGGLRRFDKQGDAFYDQISALHKAVRGSDPDAALYWLCRMLDGGCDPRYLARRVLRMASEDVGNADPRALRLALDAAEVYERLGSPEGELAIAQAVVFMACAAKSNAVYMAYKAAASDARESGSIEVPSHLRNAPTRLMKELGHGEGYHYAHDAPEGILWGEHCFPEELGYRTYYHPVPRGLEAKIAEKLDRLRAAIVERNARDRQRR